MNLQCRLLGHHRSRPYASFDEEKQTWKSWCERCGAPMIKEQDGRWRERTD